MSKIVILCCTSLKDYVEHAQKKAGTDYPVKYISRLYHRDPAEMREHIRKALEELACGTQAPSEDDSGMHPETDTVEDDFGTHPETDTVLVAMGYCGGSWDKVTVPCRVVMPRVDDCISLLLQQSDEPAFDLKKPGHLYVKDKDPGKECFRKIFDHMAEGLDEETKERYHENWKNTYSNVDIIRTEINGVDRPEYIKAVKADAEWLSADMCVVKGGTYLLEKMLKGCWDEQFLVLEPGQSYNQSASTS